MIKYRLALLCIASLPLCLSAAVGGLEGIAVPEGSIFLRWDDLTDDETGFLIERKQGSGDFVEVATLDANSVRYTDSGLQWDTAYTYRVTDTGSTSSSSLTMDVQSFPEWIVPVAEAWLTEGSKSEFNFRFAEVGAEYAVQGSVDLVNWAGSFGYRNYADAGETVTGMLLDLVEPSLFYRVVSRSPERPANIGLNMPFELPPEPDGEIWDVTLFGSSPANIDSLNDDAIGINVAISIAVPGDVVYIPEGTFTIRQILRLPSGVTLRGAGMDKTTVITEGISRAVYIEPLVTDVRIEDFAITYLGDTEELEYGIYIGSSRQGRNSERVVIDSLRIDRFSKHAVSLRDCNHVLVQNCEILNATNEGGGGHGYGVALNYPTNHNNWIRNNTIGPGIRHAVLLQYYAHNNLVEDNLAVENSEDAFDLHGEDEYSNELRFNTARNCVKDGFGVGNTGSTHDRSGPDNWIHHNVVENCQAGVEVIQGSEVVYIDRNIFRSNDYGVRVHNGSGNQVYIRNNRMENNEIGVSLKECRWIQMTGNSFDNHSQYGIEILNDVADVVDEGNTFSGNLFDYRP
ncbi:MAG: right-handed parallel beta-helix repeat-containing protein [Puniceicoccaceae bacterium]